MDKPLISIIIPLYNRIELMDDTIKSVLKQSFSHWEIIIVDDGSTDGSFEKSLNWAKSFSKIRSIQRNRLPKGAATCRNIGAEMTNGEFVMFLDSDDILEKHCLQQRVEFMLRFPDKDYWVFRTKLFHEQPGDSPYCINTPKDIDNLQRFLNLDLPWQITCVLWKKKAFNALSGFDEKALSWQDWDLHVRALIADLPYASKLDSFDSFYRVGHSNTIGKASSSSVHLLSQFELFKKNILLLKSLNESHLDDLKNSVSSLHWYFSLRFLRNNNFEMALESIRHAFKTEWINRQQYVVLTLFLCRYKKSGGSIFKRINESFWPGSLNAIDTSTWLKTKHE
jgi:glycosyltransferase involved in cell wall biosynthesis